MRYIEREGLHPLKVDHAPGHHPLDKRSVKESAIARARGQFGDDGEGGFALYSARQSLGQWRSRHMAYRRQPPLWQDAVASGLAIELNRRLAQEAGGFWFVALGEWLEPCVLLLDAAGQPRDGGYDMLMAWWNDGDGDRPWCVDYVNFARCPPDFDAFLDSCAKGDARYDEHMRDVEIEGRHMARRALGETVH